VTVDGGIFLMNRGGPHQGWSNPSPRVSSRQREVQRCVDGHHCLGRPLILRACTVRQAPTPTPDTQVKSASVDRTDRSQRCCPVPRRLSHISLPSPPPPLHAARAAQLHNVNRIMCDVAPVLFPEITKLVCHNAISVQFRHPPTHRGSLAEAGGGARKELGVLREWITFSICRPRRYLV